MYTALHCLCAECVLRFNQNSEIDGKLFDSALCMYASLVMLETMRGQGCHTDFDKGEDLRRGDKGLMGAGLPVQIWGLVRDSRQNLAVSQISKKCV